MIILDTPAPHWSVSPLVSAVVPACCCYIIVNEAETWAHFGRLRALDRAERRGDTVAGIAMAIAFKMQAGLVPKATPLPAGPCQGQVQLCVCVFVWDCVCVCAHKEEAGPSWALLSLILNTRISASHDLIHKLSRSLTTSRTHFYTNIFVPCVFLLPSFVPPPPPRPSFSLPSFLLLALKVGSHSNYWLTTCSVLNILIWHRSHHRYVCAMIWNDRQPQKRGRGRKAKATVFNGTEVISLFAWLHSQQCIFLSRH